MSPTEKRTASYIAKYGSLEAYQAKRREWASKGGKKVAQLGKSGFKTMTSEEKSAAGKLCYAAMVKKVRES